MKFISVVLILISGCARVVLDENEIDHPCEELTLNNDLYNCGSCGNNCLYQSDKIDGCGGNGNLPGQCSCGDSPPCEGNSDCRIGRCISSNREGRDCEFDDECITYIGVGHRCISGKCTLMECSPEECNGEDDDCDGEADTTPQGTPLSEWCFSGTQEQLNPPCSAGVRVCIEGVWSDCLAEISPVPEQGFLACNGLDDDCDLCIDGEIVNGECRQKDPTDFQVVFFIDQSGSMANIIQTIITAVDTFAASIPNQFHFEWAIVRFPVWGQAWNNTTPTWEILTDFTDLTTFQQTLAAMSRLTSGGEEPSWDTIYETGTGELPLNWNQDSVRVLMLFTDEEGQSYRNPLITEADMCAAQEHGEVLGFFTDDLNQIDFDDCGSWFNIHDELSLQINMMSLLDDPCE